MRGGAKGRVAADRRPERSVEPLDVRGQSGHPPPARPDRQGADAGSGARPPARSERNLEEPRIFANDLLQLRFDAALKTSGRFILNSTFGLAGLFDVASADGIARQTGDFGQTLFAWGVPSGPYTVRPYYGPATSRDALGETVDTLGDPVGWALGVPFGWPAYVGVGGLDAAARLSDFKEAEDSSIDFYSFVRSAYYQTRRAELRQALGLPPMVKSPATAGAPSR